MGFSAHNSSTRLSQMLSRRPCSPAPRRRHTGSRFQDRGKLRAVAAGGPFDQGLGSSFMTVLGCLGHLRSTVVYFYRAVDLDIHARTEGNAGIYGLVVSAAAYSRFQSASVHVSHPFSFLISPSCLLFFSFGALHTLLPSPSPTQMSSKCHPG